MVEWKKLGEVCEKTSNIKWKDQTDDKIYKYIDLSSVSLDSHKVIITTDICKQMLQVELSRLFVLMIYYWEQQDRP